MSHTVDSFDWPEYRPLWAVLKVAPIPWLVLTVAWVFVLISVLASFEVPASGSVLVGGALISEIALERLRWRTLPTDPWGHMKLVPDRRTRKPILHNEYIIAPAGRGRLGALLSLALKHEIKINTGAGDSYWYYKETAGRIDRRIYLAIIITAVAGTVLSGYGHLAFGAPSTNAESCPRVFNAVVPPDQT